MKKWFNSGMPWIWLNAAAVSISVLMVVALLTLIAVRGLGHFWPSSVIDTTYHDKDGSSYRLVGEIHEREVVPLERIDSSLKNTEGKTVSRLLIKTGNRDKLGIDFRWVLENGLNSQQTPKGLMVLERYEWGNFYGYPIEIRENGKSVSTHDTVWDALQQRLERTGELHDLIKDIEQNDIGAINYQMEQLRLKTRGLELDDAAADDPRYQEIATKREALDKKYAVLQKELEKRYTEIRRDTLIAEIMDGSQVEIPLSQIVLAYQPNDMSVLEKLGFYFCKMYDFVSNDPREANTEGGIFPAIFGTVLMVMMMSVMVTPFGVVAAVYLREYATQGPLTRLIRIAVNNLAGVPSIVYGVFGLGFFVYFLGGSIDQLFFPEAAPAPTFGTPGILWSSLTLAILTVPVVIVSTEEGLSRIPRSIREGSLALGATKAETLWRTVLPMASPAMMTGLILAIARAAGEVAPLMLVGVVKLAPSLPLDGNAPFLHLDRKFMHLGFHIYDVGFQSPNVEAARPLVYATALLLVVIIVLLNIVAIYIRNHLREKYKNLEQ